MITISLCIIVRDEEAVLARCLDSVKDVVDEIIIVDTGSVDRTKEIARKYTDKIFDFKWINDFSAARNKAFSKASMDYQMWLDADDVFPEISAQKLLSLKKTLNPDIDIVTMKYLTHFDKHGNAIFSSTRERLLKRDKNYHWTDPVHEYIGLAGNVFYSDIEVHHRKPIKNNGTSSRNLNIYTELEEKGTKFTPRQQYYFARELKDHGKWAKSAYYFEKFLDSGKGWAEDNIASCYNLALCYNALGDEEKVLPILLKSFTYDAPRAEISSEIGYYHKRKENYAMALKWFKLAASLETPKTIGFIHWDYWGYIPNIECCVCCCFLGDYKQANEFNERAASYKPNSSSVEHNRNYLKNFLSPPSHI